MEVPKVDVLGVPKREAEVVDPNPGVDPKTEGVGDWVDPNGFGFDDVAPKGEEVREGVVLPNPGVVKVEGFWPNGFAGVVDEKGLEFSWVNAGEEENGFDCCVVLVLNPIPPEVCPAGFGPPDKIIKC